MLDIGHSVLYRSISGGIVFGEEHPEIGKSIKIKIARKLRRFKVVFDLKRNMIFTSRRPY
jgi:hypothetical protein